VNPLEIRIALLRKGHTCASVARELNLSHHTVNNVLHGYGWSNRVARKFSTITEIPVSRLFPGGSAAVNARRAA
jgi:hypothetical protein